jgi:hypothetical protein
MSGSSDEAGKAGGAPASGDDVQADRSQADRETGRENGAFGYGSAPGFRPEGEGEGEAEQKPEDKGSG